MTDESLPAWYQDALKSFVNKEGVLPPPWIFSENAHPSSLQWRMGAGETYMMVFFEWWANFPTEAQRIAYFQKWPPPPRWYAWMSDFIWDLKPWEAGGEFNYQPYFDRLKNLGFPDGDRYQADLDDEQWR